MTQVPHIPDLPSVLLFDNVDALLSKKEEFMKYVSPKCRVILTCVEKQSESDFRVDGLRNDRESAWELFEAHSGKLISKQ